MLRSVLLGVVLLFPLSLAAQAQNVDELRKNVKHPDVTQAMQEYEQAVAEARAAYDKQTETAREKLLKQLDQNHAALLQRLDDALLSAAKNNQLDEALAIRALREQLAAARPELPRPGEQLRIISAFYGGNISWLDVTGKIREATRNKAAWTAVVNTSDLGDPAPGWGGPRTLIIQYATGDKVSFKTAYQDTTISLP